MPTSVTAFIDGFNLYHSIDDLDENHLKWLDLRKLCEIFAAPPNYELKKVYYFSAYATWLPNPYRRHQAYVKAIEACGTTAVLGTFKEKDRKCRRCSASWKAHEEKETDVNIALHLLDGAYRNDFHRALLVSADSDLTPAVKLLKKRFPQKEIRIVTPVARPPSAALLKAAGQTKAARIKKPHLESCLMPRSLKAADGSSITRPIDYDP